MERITTTVAVAGVELVRRLRPQSAFEVMVEKTVEVRCEKSGYFVGCRAFFQALLVQSLLGLEVVFDIGVA